MRTTPIRHVLWVSSVALFFATISVAAEVLPPPPPELNTPNEFRGPIPGTASLPLSDPALERVRPAEIYFPANPPVLGGAPPPPGPPAYVRPELRGYVAELFYAPLSSHSGISSGVEAATTGRRIELKKDQGTMLESFRSARAKLLAELRAKIASLGNAGPAERLTGFESFAREQTPGIVQLENLTEKLRANLAEDANWFALRTWRLGRGELKNPREQNRSLEWQVVRASAFYQKGLSPAQRRLLREVAMEMEEMIFAREGEQPTARFFAFFSPDTTRVRVSDDLPAPIAAQLAIYTGEKNALKTELRDTIYRIDEMSRNESRVGQLERLAAQQSSRLAALEEIAEAIRRDLAHVPGLTRLPGPIVLPGALQTRIDYWTAKATRLARDRAAAADAAVNEMLKRHAAETRKALANANGKTVYLKVVRREDTARDAVAKFNTEHAGEVAAVRKERDEIRDELQRVLGSSVDLPVDPSSQSFLAEFLQSQKVAAAYREYDIATLEPGLSPEQRRLLFGAAVVGLDLPELDCEWQPVRLLGRPVR